MDTDHRHPKTEDCLQYERPTTAMQLRAAWANRDDQYARRSTPLSDAEIEGIKAGRTRETNYLTPEERGRAERQVFVWYPPEHGR